MAYPDGLRKLVEQLELQDCGVVEGYLRVDQNYYLADDILYKTDLMSMAHSLEVRPPFLDHRIVEFAARLPQSLKIHGGQLKYQKVRVQPMCIFKPLYGPD